MNNIDLYGQISDLKEIDYRNTLAIATIIEILVANGLVSRQEFARIAQKFDSMSVEELKSNRAK